MKPKVLVAMSGGVDSSVAALILKRKGYEIIGVFMKNYSDSKNEFGECSWKGERKVAIKIASILKIPLITLDFEKQYKKEVIEKMFRDYRRGFTPNPDIDCNQKVKFPLLIKAAKKLGCDFVVTGHYARIKKINVGKKDVRSSLFHSHISHSINNKERSVNINSPGREGGNKRAKASRNFTYKLLRAKDESKDQSYFLYRLKQNELKHLLFPIGNYTKKQIREIAKKNKFPNYDKKSTVGICFVGKVNLKKFLQKKIKPKKGKILNPQGEVIGEHDGIYYYTIGQRIGMRFGIEISKKDDDKNFMKRWYVVKKDSKKNILITAPEGHPLNFRKEICIKNPSWINSDFISKLKINSVGAGGRGRFDSPKKILARIRQVGELLPCKLIIEKNKFKVILNKAITGISEGQAIVLYKGKKVLGGGEIRFG